MSLLWATFCVASAWTALHALLIALPGLGPWLTSHNVTVSYLSITWVTSRGKDFVHRLGGQHATFWKRWFDVGVVVGILGSVLSCLILLYNLYLCYLKLTTPQLVPEASDVTAPVTTATVTSSPPSTPSPSPPAPPPAPIITPLVPGVNFPLSELVLLWVAVLFNVVLHEGGHAVAAARERIQTLEVGFFFMFIFPGAYVRLDPQVGSIATMKQLRIFCGGVWHNVVTAAAIFVTLKALPTLSSGLTYIHNGAGIVSIPENAVMASVSQVGDIVTDFNFCKVAEVNELKECISINTPHASGICVDPPSWDEVNSDCCEGSGATSELCFHDNDGKHGCFSPKVFDSNSKVLSLCSYSGHQCEEGVCVTLEDPDATSFVRLVVHRPGVGPGPVWYLGMAEELLNGVHFSDFLLRPPWNYVLPITTVDTAFKLLSHMLSVAAALALLNIAPVFFLDGEALYERFLEVLMPNTQPRILRKTTHVILWCGSGLLLGNLLLSFALM